jgi:hypothetical protein
MISPNAPKREAPLIGHDVSDKGLIGRVFNGGLKRSQMFIDHR